MSATTAAITMAPPINARAVGISWNASQIQNGINGVSIVPISAACPDGRKREPSMNRLRPSPTWKTPNIASKFNRQVDLRVLELWQQGRYREFIDMLPDYATKCNGEGGMADTIMLFAALGWYGYEGRAEQLCDYFQSRGSGQVNVEFHVAARCSATIICRTVEPLPPEADSGYEKPLTTFSIFGGGIMKRRKFLALVGLAPTLLSPAFSQSAKRFRIGILVGTSESDPEARNRITGFVLALRDLGWIDGLNIEVIKRFARGRPETLPSLALELVDSHVDVIVTEAAQPTDAARKATSKIPIVMSYIGDALASGYVASLSRPGGNVTGQTLVATDQAAKRLELISRFLPGVKRIAVFSNANASGHKMQRKEMSAAAPALNIELDLYSMTAAGEIETSLQSAIQNHAQAIITMEDPMVESARKRIVSTAMANGIPVMGEFRPMTETGGLMNYGPNQIRMWERSAVFVDKILKGADPANLPIEQPVKFELVVNLKTAKTLNLEVPHALLVGADEIIE